jgi:hypothetical protein
MHANIATPYYYPAHADAMRCELIHTSSGLSSNHPPVLFMVRWRVFFFLGKGGEVR